MTYNNCTDRFINTSTTTAAAAAAAAAAADNCGIEWFQLCFFCVC